eukprot:CAMPEP_0114428902 /NCGR_PEP_ID=MMETSP0103-20121206/9189_1 /TAXON_ID=37642 ORGANISM="Paraphysomonas imperforata, Strain PA2" /NCGR_SAMPLE_ID=MMETSP0103 /ASSEMBLY_ACC=CAM_ASM_000201 /LENGTH=68 /DNA_ID=CAMNT_0001598181 /DNA_START=29 /DNA_END=235 /DNA_ORIENTATION=+
MSSNQKDVNAVTLLEEDDEFEEFENGTWEDVEEDTEDGQLWQDDWDDDDTNDDFTEQLRQQFESTAEK